VVEGRKEERKEVSKADDCDLLLGQTDVTQTLHASIMHSTLRLPEGVFRVS